MKRIFHSLFVKIVFISLIFLSVLMFFIQHEFEQMQRENMEMKARVITLIEKEQPEMKGQLLDIFAKGEDELSKEELLQINNYGLDLNQLNFENQISFYKSFFVVLSITLIFVLLCIFLVYRIHYQYDQKVLAIDDYLRDILAHNYNLQLSKNEEGVLSVLYNDIYKVMVMLKENNKELSEEKSQLSNDLADISHQLKTPLTSMSMMCELLMQEELSKDERQQFLKNISTQVLRIEWLVSSLLKLSKLDTKTVRFSKEDISMKELIHRASESLLLTMDVKNQLLIVEGDDPIVNVDINWSREAFLNIMKNCVEHTPNSGTLKIDIMDSAMCVQVRIKDSGSGIDEGDLPHIFKRFYRGKNANSDSVGIGLAMAKAVIEEQGGTISVDSIKGKGSTFIIRFFRT